MQEMRQFERDDFDTPVIYSTDQFNSHHDGRMHNFSENGMYVKSDVPLKPGSKVYVRTVYFCSVSKCEVKWCKKVEEDHPESEHFGIGLQCEI